MKKFLILSFLTVGMAMTYSQNLLNNQWKFSTGDDLGWKDIDFDESGWATIKSGQTWEVQGYQNYDGFAWYRKSIVIPTELKKQAIDYEGLTLNLGCIDDADEIYFNGKLLGATGSLPPGYQSAYDKIRNWNIDVNDVLWGEKNVIAVRVFDGGGGGGIVNENISLTINGMDSKVDLSIEPGNPDFIFLNEDIIFPIKINNDSKHNIKGQVEYCIKNDFGDIIWTSQQNVSLPKQKTRTITLNKGRLAPGFYTIYIDLSSEIVNLSKSFSFGVDPEKIVSPTEIPADFENYWMRAKRELAAVDPQFKLIYKDSLSNEKRDVYLVEMRSLGNVKIRGWYAHPKAKGKYPAILRLQGYSSNAQMISDYPDDMAVFVLNIRGHGNSQDNINPGFPGYLLHNIEDKEMYIYRGAYMDCIRAVDFLWSREEVDNRYIIAEGGSQGGALSIATAALDNERISLCVPAVPFLSDFPDYFRTAAWPVNEFNEYVISTGEQAWDRIFETLRYIDIKNLAPWIKCPVRMSVGLKDTTCPPHINFAAYNQLNVPKSYIVYPEAGHGLPSEETASKYEWIKRQLDLLMK